jgi:hypothetical protein
VEFGSSFVADEQTAKLVQPGEGSLDDPAEAAQAGTMPASAPGDHGFNAPLPELAAVTLRVVAAIGDELLGPAARASDTAAHQWHPVDEREQLGDVVVVAARERVGERDARLVDNQVVLGAQPSAVNRARARRGAPLFACTWLESTTARAHSI